MNKKKIGYLIFVSLIVITTALIFSSLFLQLKVSAKVGRLGTNDNDTSYTKYIALIAETKNSPFWQEVYKGAREAAEVAGYVVELLGPSSDAEKKTIDFYFEYAIAAKADGIISFVDKDFEEKNILKATSKGTPLIVLENDGLVNTRISFVGVSSYELGRLFGESLNTLEQNPLKILLLSEQNNLGSIMFSGLKSTLNSNKSTFFVSLEKKDLDRLLYEEVIKKSLIKDDINTIISLRIEDTILAAEALIELNLTNQISIIAFRDSPEIYTYIQKGLVHSVIVADAFQMGFKAMQSMIEYFSSGHTNDYIITDLHVLNSTIIKDF